MIAALLRKLRAWRIAALEHDISHACGQFDCYLQEQSDKLAELRRKQYEGLTSEHVARRCEARAKAL